MVKRRSLLTGFLTAVVLAAFAGAASTVDAEPKLQLAVIVAKDSPISELSIYDLKRLYKGETINAAGKRLVPLNLAPPATERAAFDRVVLGMNPENIARYWIDRKIRGQSGPPKNIDSPDLLQRVVGRVDGAVGYVKFTEVRPDVKAIRIDGKSPKDSGYPLTY